MTKHFLVPFKSPAFTRFFSLPIVAVMLLGVAHAGTLTESDVIRIARSQDPHILAARAEALFAGAEEVRAGLYPNPSANWQRERSPEITAPTEDSLYLTLPIEFTGRRPAEKALARSSAALARAHAAQTETHAVTASLELFYDHLAATREGEIWSQTLTRLDEAVRVVARRHEEGTVAGYERARLELEAEVARSERRLAASRAKASIAALAVLLGLDAERVTASGSFDISVTSSHSERASDTPGVQPLRPAMALFQVAEREAKYARAAADWAWVPPLSVTGGVRLSDQSSDRYGYTAGVSLELPVLSWGQDLRAEASAAETRASTAGRLASRTIGMAEARAREALEASRTELGLFSEGSRERALRLLRAVESGYAEGRHTVIELVDAQRASAEVERRCLEIEVQAKRAQLSQRAAQGEFER